MKIRKATQAEARGIASVHVRAWQSAYAGITPAQALDALSVDQREEKWNEIPPPTLLLRPRNMVDWGHGTDP